MYIVYDTDNDLDALRSKYLVLELDTIEINDSDIMTAHAIIDSESVPFDEVNKLADIRELHANLISSYKGQNWDACDAAIAQLIGCFKGSLDSYYTEMHDRLRTLRQATIAADWTGVIKQQ